MDIIQNTLQELSQSFGLPSFELQEKEQLTLEIENIGELNLEILHTTLVLRLVRTYMYADEEKYKTALSLCHFAKGNIFPVRVGMNNAEISFMVQLPEPQCTLQNALSAIHLLNSLHNTLEYFHKG